MQGNAVTTGILVVAMVAVFYFLIIRPQRRRQQEQQKIQTSMQPGARVMLSSGIYGTVVSVGEKQAVVELAPGTEVTVLKQVIMQVVTPDSAYAEDTPQSSAPGAIGGVEDPAPEGVTVDRPETSEPGPSTGSTVPGQDEHHGSAETGEKPAPDDRPDTDPKA